MAGNLAMFRIGNIGAVVIEGAERANHAAHNRHRVRITAETLVELPHLVMQHGVIGDRVREIVENVLLGQFPIQHQIGHFHEAGMFSQLANGIATVKQHTFIAIDICQCAFAAGSRFIPGIKCESAGLAVEFADIDDIGSTTSLQRRKIETFAANCQFCLLICQWGSPLYILYYTSLHGRSDRNLRINPREAFLPSQEDEHIENSGRGSLPCERRTKRLRKFAKAETQLFRVGFQIGLQRG